MGGGNGQKSAAARARNQLKAAKNKKKTSNLAALKAQPKVQCKRCLATFGATTQKAELEKHCNNKHKAFDFKFSFPNFGKVKTAAPVSKYAPDKEKKQKKNKKKRRG